MIESVGEPNWQDLSRRVLRCITRDIPPRFMLPIFMLSGIMLLCGLTVTPPLNAQTTEPQRAERSAARQLLATYCFDCHDESSKASGLHLAAALSAELFDGQLLFENLITATMPPRDAAQPTVEERRQMLRWLAQRQPKAASNAYRRISRYEFVHSVCDLLSIDLDIAESIPEDRGTNDFDSNRRIMLTKEMLDAYFSAADEMLEFAIPSNGFSPQQIWVTNKLRDSHQTYNIYTRPYQDGILFSWTRANNGNSYSFFYDDFTPPEAGWYELTFDAAKVGAFPEDVSILVYTGKYYFADDRPQPQRLVGVISVGSHDVASYKLRGFLRPGENVSVHCYSKHTWRQRETKEGAYIEQLRVRGPVVDGWPTSTYQKLFADLTLRAEDRTARTVKPLGTALQRIGGRITVSSFEPGMEKEKMQDGSNRTFWHTRFTPDVAKPPHYVIVENPNKMPLAGLSYSTWAGGNGNGQVKAYEVAVSDDGHAWSEPLVAGKLEVRLAAEQEIRFPSVTQKPYIKLLVTDAISLDGKSLASIGKLDVLVEPGLSSDVSTGATAAQDAFPSRPSITISPSSRETLQPVIKRFAENAFATSLSEEELAPYYQVGLRSLAEQGDLAAATKQAIKAIVCSHRFLLAPGTHQNASYRKAAQLARALWLSVPDDELLQLAKTDLLTRETMRVQIDRMLKSERSSRMVHSFCDQWLNLRSFNKVSPSLKLYPTYNDLLNHFLPLETEAFISHLIRDNLPVSNLIDANFSILNQRLAQHYGVDGVIGQSMRPVSFAPDSPRGGLLTMGSVLKVTTDGFATSPILRGAWISRNIAGNTLSPPPESVEAIEADHAQPKTLKEQIEAHKSNESCYACHKRIDPYGFALENFDATGQWRTQYRVEQPHPGTFQYRQQGYYKIAGDVDASGELGAASFGDVTGLKQILLKDQKQVAYNLAKKLFEYANGAEPTLEQRLELFAFVPDAAEECRMKDLITDVLVYSFAGGDE